MYKNFVEHNLPIVRFCSFEKTFQEFFFFFFSQLEAVCSKIIMFVVTLVDFYMSPPSVCCNFRYKQMNYNFCLQIFVDTDLFCFSF